MLNNNRKINTDQMASYTIVKWFVCGFMFAVCDAFLPVYDHTRAVDSHALQSCLSPDLEQKEHESCRFFAIIIDAGSTGTRLHLFEFSHDVGHEATPFKVEKETFQEVKPGLSSFADHPELAADSVAELLETAKATIPPHLWHQTPLALKATAGLRLLSETQVDEILDAVYDTISMSPFLINEDSVVVMSGTDEGVFAWFTLNVLLDRMDTMSNSMSCTNGTTTIDDVSTIESSESSTVAALDLGGGSTQITIQPFDDRKVERQFQHTMNVFGRHVQLYTKSYLGNGLVAGRLGILQSHSQSFGSKLISDCMPDGYRLYDWDYAGRIWKVGGSRQYSPHNCLSSAADYIAKMGIRPMEELSSRDIFAFSYFFDRGLQAGLVSNMSGGLTTVGAFKKAAKKACKRGISDMGVEHWRPWQCLDLSYIYALLHKGYRLHDDKQIYLAKKLKGMETSWGLGAAYHLLNTYHEEQRQRQQQQYVVRQSTSINTSGSDYLYGHMREFVYKPINVLFSFLNLIST